MGSEKRENENSLKRHTRCRESGIATRARQGLHASSISSLQSTTVAGFSIKWHINLAIEEAWPELAIEQQPALRKEVSGSAIIRCEKIASHSFQSHPKRATSIFSKLRRDACLIHLLASCRSKDGCCFSGGRGGVVER